MLHWQALTVCSFYDKVGIQTGVNFAYAGIFAPLLVKSYLKQLDGRVQNCYNKLGLFKRCGNPWKLQHFYYSFLQQTYEILLSYEEGAVITNNTHIVASPQMLKCAIILVQKFSIRLTMKQRIFSNMPIVDDAAKTGIYYFYESWKCVHGEFIR